MKRLLLTLLKIFVGGVVLYLSFIFLLSYMVSKSYESDKQTSDADEFLAQVNDYLKKEIDGDFSIYRSRSGVCLDIKMFSDKELLLSDLQIQEIKALIKQDFAFKKVIFRQSDINVPPSFDLYYNIVRLR